MYTHIYSWDGSCADGHLDAVAASIEPLRKEFSISKEPLPSVDKADMATASLLQAPLYLIYMQVFMSMCECIHGWPRNVRACMS
jgi:hypothetical protein